MNYLDNFNSIDETIIVVVVQRKIVEATLFGRPFCLYIYLILQVLFHVSRKKFAIKELLLKLTLLTNKNLLDNLRNISNVFLVGEVGIYKKKYNLHQKYINSNRLALSRGRLMLPLT